MNNEPKAGKGIDPEMLAAYIDNRLPPEQRAAVEAQLATDPESLALLVDTLEALDDDEVKALEVKEPSKQPIPFASKAPKSRFRALMIGGGALAAAAAIVLVVMQPSFLRRYVGSDVDSRFERLVAAVGEERYFEARISGGFSYGPLRPVTRGTPLSSQNLELLAEAGRLQRLSQTEPSAQNLHAWGVAQVLLGDLDNAIASLESASQIDAGDTRVLSDLSAAYLTRATQNNRADDFPRALETAAKAIRIATNPDPELLFNRALAAEALNLRGQATVFWNEYLAAEPNDDWRRVAQEHLKTLQSQGSSSWLPARSELVAALDSLSQPAIRNIITRFPQQAREYNESSLLAKWADELLQSAGDHSRTLAQVGALSSALEQYNRDRLDTVVFERLSVAGRTTQLAFARTVSHYGAARRLYEAGEVSKAAPLFARARDEFAKLDSPFKHWADLDLSVVDYYNGDYGRSAARAALVAGEAHRESFLAVEGRARWLVGLALNLQGQYASATRHFEAALGIFKRAGERDNEAALHSVLAAALLYVGDDQQVWAHTLETLALMTPDTPSRRRHTQLVSAANKSTRLALHDAALVFADEAHAAAVVWGDALALIEVSSFRARTFAALGERESATEALRHATLALEKVRDPVLKGRIDAEVMQTSADVDSVADPARGIESVSRAIDYFSRSRSFPRTPRLLLTRAAARRRLGDTDGANADLQSAIDHFEAERRTIPSGEIARLSHTDVIWSAYSQLLDLRIEQGASCEELLAAADRGRGLMLRERWRNGAATVRPANGEAVIHYAFHASGLQQIVLSPGKCVVRQLPVKKSSATSLVADLTLAIEQRRFADYSRLGSELFTAVVGEAAQELKGVTRVTIIPDGPLHQLAFAALPTPGGRFLIEDVDIRLAPALYHRILRRPGFSRQALVVRGVDGGTFGLPPLTNTSAERDSVAAALGAAAVVSDASTVQELLKQLPHSGIFHFSGHAIANNEFPAQSRLLVGPDESDTAWLMAGDVSALDLQSLELVFLSACSTQSGKRFGGEGPASLAHSFLLGGSENVVASLWPVEDQDAAQFVGRFYRAWPAHRDAAKAIREAALESLKVRGRESVFEWSPWVVIGDSEGEPL